jgi:hypothetical protein
MHDRRLFGSLRLVGLLVSTLTGQYVSVKIIRILIFSTLLSWLCFDVLLPYYLLTLH